jgi:hypothetical protein
MRGMMKKNMVSAVNSDRIRRNSLIDVNHDVEGDMALSPCISLAGTVSYRDLTR